MADQQQPPQLVKLDVCLYKNPDIAFDDFVKWVTKDYPPRAIPIMKKHGIVQWAQTITPPQFRQPFREALQHEMNRPNWTVPDYDIVMSYWLRDLTDMRGLTADPEWHAVEEEAQKWANMADGHFVIGYEIVMLPAGDSSEVRGGVSA